MTLMISCFLSLMLVQVALVLPKEAACFALRGMPQVQFAAAAARSRGSRLFTGSQSTTQLPADQVELLDGPLLRAVSVHLCQARTSHTPTCPKRTRQRPQKHEPHWHSRLPPGDELRTRQVECDHGCLERQEQ